MGVEYKHFIIPANPSFVPTKGVVVNVDRVLSKWKLKATTPKIYDLTDGKNAEINDELNSLNFEHGIAIEYSGVDGIVAAEIMGKSYYQNEISDEDRYIQSITFIVGLDYRVHPSGDELTMTVNEGPLENSNPIEPYCEYDELFYGLHAEVYSSSLSTLPPGVDINVADKNRIIGGQSFSGFWRTAIVIDCGKDLPGLSSEIYKIPNKVFISDIEGALGCKTIEIGEVC